jgi:uncharacterized protein YecE (DUF72 family)
MADQVHVGCADLPHGVGWERYFEKLSFIETSILVRNPAKPSVLARWRSSAPGPGAFSVLAPEITPTGVTRGVAPLVEALRVLEAGAVVFQTPPGFSPSSANRDQLRRFFSETFPAEATPAVRVWQPSGLWEVRPAVTLATELGVVLGWDPLLRDPTQDPPDLFATLEVPDVYFRVAGLGRGSRTLSAAQMDELAGLVESYDRLWMVFATVGSLADATRFQRTIGLTADDQDQK